ncbi:MAG: UPF0149 family protein [Gammaproteobacteria bacterium]
MDFASALHTRLEAAIASDGLGVDASACHGLLCGLLCGRNVSVEDGAGETATADLIEQALRLLAEDAPAAMVPDETLRLLVHTMNWTAGELGQDDFRLALVLPDEAAPVSLRTAALGEWVHGFLLGLGLGGDHSGASDRGGGADPADPLAREYGWATDADTRELLVDFAELTRVDTDVEDGDDAERDLLELVEFVRVGTMVLYEASISPPAHGPGGCHRAGP